MSMYTMGQDEKPTGIMSPVPSNVQPGLTLSGAAANDYVNMRGNITPINMSTPGSHSASHHNVRIESIQHSHHQSPSVNSTDPTRTQNHLFAPHTVPSNGFASPHISAATQPQVSLPSSLPPLPSSVSGIPVSAAGGPGHLSHTHATVVSSAAASTPIPAAASPAPATPAPSRGRNTPRAGGRRGRSSAAGNRSNSGAANSAGNKNNGTAAGQAQAQTPALSSQGNISSPDSPQQDSQHSLAHFAPVSDALPTSAVTTATLPSLNSTLNSSLMAPSPTPTPNSNNASGQGQGQGSNTAQLLLPPPEGIYRNFEELLRAVQQMAKDQGYSVVKLRASNYRDGKPTRYDLVCDRGGVKYSSTAKKRNPSTRKVDCPWRAKAVCEVQLGNQWRFQVQDSRHNHEPRIQVAMAGMEQTPTSQYLRTISNKVDRMNHDLTTALTRIESHLESLDKRLENMETRMVGLEGRMGAMESQNRMEMDMDVESRLLASSSIIPGSQQPEPGQDGQGQMPPAFTYPGA